MRPGQRTITVLMLLVCAAVGVAIAGVPHGSGEPAIRLTDQTTDTSADPALVPGADATTTTSTATTATTTTTTRPATTTTKAAKKATPTTAAPKPVVATTVAKTSQTTVTPTGLNPDGR